MFGSIRAYIWSIVLNTVITCLNVVIEPIYQLTRALIGISLVGIIALALAFPSMTGYRQRIAHLVLYYSVYSLFFWEYGFCSILAFYSIFALAKRKLPLAVFYMVLLTALRSFNEELSYLIRIVNGNEISWLFDGLLLLANPRESKFFQNLVFREPEVVTPSLYSRVMTWLSFNSTYSY